VVSVEPDREYYEGVGRVVMVAAFWELALASVVAAADPDSDIWTVASQPGRPLKIFDGWAVSYRRGPGC